MRKTISIILLALFVVSISFALTVSVKDKGGFEIDVFNAGETAVITAQASEQAYITVAGPGIALSSQKMKETEDGVYTYDLVPKGEGEYNVEIEAGKESEQLTIFAAEGLNLDWNKVDANNSAEQKIIQLQPNQTAPAKSAGESVLIVGENGTERIIYDDTRTGFFDSCLSFLKKLEGILNG